jgi:hypothetical protein
MEIIVVVEGKDTISMVQYTLMLRIIQILNLMITLNLRVEWNFPVLIAMMMIVMVMIVALIDDAKNHVLTITNFKTIVDKHSLNKKKKACN